MSLPGPPRIASAAASGDRSRWRMRAIWSALGVESSRAPRAVPATPPPRAGPAVRCGTSLRAAGGAARRRPAASARRRRPQRAPPSVACSSRSAASSPSPPPPPSIARGEGIGGEVARRLPCREVGCAAATRAPTPPPPAFRRSRKRLSKAPRRGSRAGAPRRRARAGRGRGGTGEPRGEPLLHVGVELRRSRSDSRGGRHSLRAAAARADGSARGLARLCCGVARRLASFRASAAARAAALEPPRAVLCARFSCAPP